MDRLFSRGSTPPTYPHHLDNIIHSNVENNQYQNSDSNSNSQDDNTSIPGVSSTERQNALLHLLGSVSISGQSTTSQQIPTPPSSSQRSGPSPQGNDNPANNNANNESQGKFLLEQLMSGSVDFLSWHSHHFFDSAILCLHRGICMSNQRNAMQ